MPRANEIKKGMVLNYNGKLLLVKDIDIQSPTARGAATLYKMRFSDVRTGLKVEERFKGDDIVDTVTLTRRYVDFSYVDGNEYVFMDKEDYTPYTFTKDQIEEELLFMPEGGMPDMQVLTWDGQLLALELPQTVDLEIVETAKRPGVRQKLLPVFGHPDRLGGDGGADRPVRAEHRAVSRCDGHLGGHLLRRCGPLPQLSCLWLCTGRLHRGYGRPACPGAPRWRLYGCGVAGAGNLAGHSLLHRGQRCHPAENRWRGNA